MARAGGQIAVTAVTGALVHQGWQYYVTRRVGSAVVDLVIQAGQYALQEDSVRANLIESFKNLFYLGGFVLLLEWGPLVVRLVHSLSRVLLFLVCGAVELLETAVEGYWHHRRVLERAGIHRTELLELTCDRMAALVAAGGNPFPVGSFAVVSRPPVFDEVWVAAQGPGAGEILARTTNEDGSDWVWVVVQPVGGQMLAPTLVGDNRRPPHGVPANSVNWVCVPPNSDAKWVPNQAEIMGLIRDATQLVGQLQQAGPGSYPVNQAGVGGRLEPVQVPVTAPMVAAAPNLVAPGGGVGGGAGRGIGSAESFIVGRRNEGEEGPQERQKEETQEGQKEKEEETSEEKFFDQLIQQQSVSVPFGVVYKLKQCIKSEALRWKESAKDKHVAYTDLAHVEGLKWKKKGDLIAFATKHPGALTAHFLAGVYARLSKGTLSRSSQLREASVAAWAHQFTGLTEIRDIKEVLTLAEILDSVNRREIARALDILCQRILAIQAAKMKGGSWEKAEAIELISTQKSLASTGMLALTNA
eukprot:s2228_g3.t2